MNILDYHAHPFFTHFSKIELENLCSHASEKQFSKDTMIFLQGDEAKYFYIILEGWVKLFRETVDGQEAINHLATKDDIIAENLLVEGSSYPYSAMVIEACTVIMIPHAALRKLIAANSNLAMNIIASMSSQLSQLELQLEQLSIMNAPQRIGCFLLKYCGNQPQHHAKILLPYDKSLIATKLAMQPETFSRGMKQLQQVGITMSAKKVMIDDVNALRQYVCNACSQGNICENSKQKKC